MSGGEQPGSWSWNSLLILNLDLDSEKLIGWKGGKFGIDFLQFDGEPTNERAGSVQGYNSLPGPPPLHRSELYELWWRQELFDRKLIIRIGKTVPTVDFNNVLRPVPTQDQSLFIPSVSGLLFTPVFKNATLIGAMPGYYNSAFGVTTTFAPTNNFYLSYGVYRRKSRDEDRKPGRKDRNLMAIISILARRARPGRSAATICRAHLASACGIKQATCERVM